MIWEEATGQPDDLRCELSLFHKRGLNQQTVLLGSKSQKVNCQQLLSDEM